MIKLCLIVLSILAAAAAIPLPSIDSDDLMFNASIDSDDLMFNASSSAYNPSAAVAYARANCASGPGLCAEFASRAMAAGGAGNPIMPRVVDLIAVSRVASPRARARLMRAAVDDSQRLEDDRLCVLRPPRRHCHLRHHPRRQQSRSILHGWRSHLTAQPLPLQVPIPLLNPVLPPFLPLYIKPRSSSLPFYHCLLNPVLPPSLFTAIY
jgi:hypothetical protein